MPAPPIADFAIVIGMGSLVAIFWHEQQWRERSGEGNGRQETVDWLTRLADEQDQSIESFLHFPQRNSPLVNVELNEPELVVDLRIEVINASVFDLKIDKIEGRLKWDGNEFLRDMELIGHDRTAKAGQPKAILVRQPMKTEEVMKIKAIGRILFNIDGLVVSFTYTNRKGNAQTAKRVLPSSTHSWG